MWADEAVSDLNKLKLNMCLLFHIFKIVYNVSMETRCHSNSVGCRLECDFRAQHWSDLSRAEAGEESGWGKKNAERQPGGGSACLLTRSDSRVIFSTSPSQGLPPWWKHYIFETVLSVPDISPDVTSPERVFSAHTNQKKSILQIHHAHMKHLICNYLF